MRSLLAVIFGAVLSLHGCGNGCSVSNGFDPDGDAYKNSDLGKCQTSARDKLVEAMGSDDAATECKATQETYDCLSDCCDIKAKGADVTAKEMTKAGVEGLNAEGALCAEHALTDPCA